MVLLVVLLLALLPVLLLGQLLARTLGERRARGGQLGLGAVTGRRRHGLRGRLDHVCRWGGKEGTELKAERTPSCWGGWKEGPTRARKRHPSTVFNVAGREGQTRQAPAR